MSCEDVVLTAPCLEAEIIDGALTLNVVADGSTIVCTDEGLQAVGGGFTAVAPISWSGLTPSCICPNAVRIVNGGESFAPELYATQFSVRDGLLFNQPGDTPANVIGVPVANQPGDPSQFHPITGWGPVRQTLNLGTVGSPILNPYCRPMFIWFLIRTRVQAVTGPPTGTIIHQSSYSLNGAPEVLFTNLTLARSNTTGVSVANDSSVMETPTGLVGLQVPPGGSFYLQVDCWVDQLAGLFSPGNAAFDTEIQIDALALAYSGNPPANGCPVVSI